MDNTEATNQNMFICCLLWKSWLLVSIPKSLVSQWNISLVVSYLLVWTSLIHLCLWTQSVMWSTALLCCPVLLVTLETSLWESAVTNTPVVSVLKSVYVTVTMKPSFIFASVNVAFTICLIDLSGSTVIDDVCVFNNHKYQVSSHIYTTNWYEVIRLQKTNTEILQWLIFQSLYKAIINTCSELLLMIDEYCLMI